MILENQNDMLSLLNRQHNLFNDDLVQFESRLKKEVSRNRFLVLGGAGSIGQAVVKELFKRDPKKLHVVDISENNLTELVRDLRSSFGYISGEFKTFALDIDSVEFDGLIKSGDGYDYVLNLSALKHVRSEEDPYTLMRMLDVNIFNTKKTIEQAIKFGAKKYFCVSTDKAANPVNMMGASKRVMELFLSSFNTEIAISTARFANVAFSDGSLLHGFVQRIAKMQPLVAPNDIRRYFVTPQESGLLCLMSCIFGETGDIFFPKLDPNQHLAKFSDIAVQFLKQKGYQAHFCKTEDEARSLVKILPQQGFWPCLFTQSNTTGEKDVEEFFTEKELLDLTTFSDIGVVKSDLTVSQQQLNNFTKTINELKEQGVWHKRDIIEQVQHLLPEFLHKDTGLYLDGKM